jgi:hypothetical protein
MGGMEIPDYCVPDLHLMRLWWPCFSGVFVCARTHYALTTASMDNSRVLLSLDPRVDTHSVLASGLLSTCLWRCAKVALILCLGSSSSWKGLTCPSVRDSRSHGSLCTIRSSIHRRLSGPPLAGFGLGLMEICAPVLCLRSHLVNLEAFQKLQSFRHVQKSRGVVQISPGNFSFLQAWHLVLLEDPGARIWWLSSWD